MLKFPGCNPRKVSTINTPINTCPPYTLSLFQMLRHGQKPETYGTSHVPGICQEQNQQNHKSGMGFCMGLVGT